MSSDIKLLPCPFCGGGADLVEQKHREYPSTYYVRCKMCHCKSLERVGAGIVIEAWNTRKPMDNIVERLEENSYIETVSDLDPYGDIPTKVVRLERAIDLVKAGGKE